VSNGPTTDTLPPRPYLIGVAGGSNSGKTTITRRLSELIGPERLSLIKLDSYYTPMRSTGTCSTTTSPP